MGWAGGQGIRNGEGENKDRVWEMGRKDRDRARDKDRNWGGCREGGRAGVSWFCVAQGGDSASVPWDR